MNDQITVLVAEDSPATSRALRELLEEVSGEFRLVGMVEDALAAVDLARHTRPDVALLDVAMPGGGGVAATDGIRAVSPSTKVIAYSVADDRDSVIRMLRSGARGYLLKGSGTSELLDGLRACAAGRTTISPGLSPLLFEELSRQALGASEAERRDRYEADQIKELFEPGGLVAVYQPIRDLDSGRVAGFEALARFADGRPPDEVFHRAYGAGLGLELELHAARVQVDAFRESGLDGSGTYLAVNASSGSLLSPLMVEVLNPRGAEMRVIELTEHYDGDGVELQAAVRAARLRGLRVAVDDAGTGFSGLKRIVELAPDILKLDRSLIAGVDADRSKRALVSALTSYCEEMGFVAVAEGIETARECDTLRALGVRHGQGYLLGKPGPLAASAGEA